jgi:hypothetical protein
MIVNEATHQEANLLLTFEELIILNGSIGETFEAIKRWGDFTLTEGETSEARNLIKQLNANLDNLRREFMSINAVAHQEAHFELPPDKLKILNSSVRETSEAIKELRFSAQMGYRGSEARALSDKIRVIIDEMKRDGVAGDEANLKFANLVLTYDELVIFNPSCYL